ncbi:unnamed protein product [Prorocentrum cordatum]|uniref:Uncharacterized protein n=1 Tax=Prorocentrum cordatum TaxID=2364126 RepID=A0ABN9X6P4_9DINO|nr:unnamed protein product [Polarella glacialis]
MAVAAARVLVGMASSRGRSAVRPCGDRCCAGGGLAAGASRAGAAVSAAGQWLGSSLADFQRAVEDSVLQESFAEGPREHFRRNRIPWSYDPGSSEELGGVFARRAGGPGARDGEPAPSAAEGGVRPAIEAV